MQKDPGDFHLSIESLEFERDIIKIIYDKYNEYCKYHKFALPWRKYPVKEVGILVRILS